MDINVQYINIHNADYMNEITTNRIIAIYNWNTSGNDNCNNVTHSTSLQSIQLLPPMSNNNDYHNVNNLFTSDGILFLTGTTQKRQIPCVFYKTHNASSWSNYPLELKYTIMAMTINTNYKLIGVVTSNNIITIFGYKSLLLHSSGCITMHSTYKLFHDGDGNEHNILSLGIPSSSSSSSSLGNTAQDDTKTTKTTTSSSISFLSYSSSSILLLAVMHYNQIYIYSIPTTKNKKIDDTSSTPIASSKIIYTSTAITKDEEYEDGTTNNEIMPNDIIVKCASITCFQECNDIYIGLYTKSTFSSDDTNTYYDHLSFLHLDIQSSLSSSSNTTNILPIVSHYITNHSSLLSSSSIDMPMQEDVSIMYYKKLNSILLLSSKQSYTLYSPYVKTDNALKSLFHSYPICTQPLGLSSNGSIMNNNNENSSIYYIHVDISKHENKLLKRFLLVATTDGNNNAQEDNQGTYGGAESNIVLDISYYINQMKLQDYILPSRIVTTTSPSSSYNTNDDNNNKDASSLIVILFSYKNASSLHYQQQQQNHPIAYTIYNKNNNTISSLYEGRDIIFLPSSLSNNRNAIVVNNTGKSFYKIKYDNDDNNWIRTSSSIPFSFEDDDDDMNIQRIFLLSKTKVIKKKNRQMQCYNSLVLFAINNNNNKCCIILGPFIKQQRSINQINKLLPTSSSSSSNNNNNDNNCVLYLNSNEKNIISFIQLRQNNNTTLEKDDNNSILFAISTESRILIISYYNLSIITSIDTFHQQPYYPSLVSYIGSRTIIYCMNNKLYYMACDLPFSFDDNSAAHVLSTLPQRNDNVTTPMLVAIRPDRYVVQYNTTTSPYSAIKKKKKNHIALPLPITKPLLLLEPLVSNLLSEYITLLEAEYDDDDSTIIYEFYNKLKYIFQRFGKKTSSFPYMDNEGIGTQGMFYISLDNALIFIYGLLYFRNRYNHKIITNDTIFQ